MIKDFYSILRRSHANDNTILEYLHMLACNL